MNGARIRKNIEGLFMLVIAALCIWLPTHLKQEGVAHHNILVASEELKDSVFDNTVIVMVNHTGYSALGFVVNKPGKGGPVLPREKHILYVNPDGMPAATEGEDASLIQPVPAHYMALAGRAGWGVGQLKREIRRGTWKVISFDEALVFETDPQIMWETAIKRPDIRAVPEE